MNKTSIEWTTFSANPIKYRRKSDGKTVWACVKTSPGCAHCYSETIALRWDRGKLFNAANMEELEPFLDEAECHKMRTAKAIGGVPVDGTRCFLGDMTDIFGDWVPVDLLNRLFSDVLERRTDVTWQILTKRAARMSTYLQWRWGGGRIPSRNIWIGVSVEDQHQAEERIPHLVAAPAAVRFLSCEPLLGRLDLRSWLGCEPDRDGSWRVKSDLPMDPEIDQCIVGCESRGAKAGRFAGEYESAARSVIAQCRVTGVATFHKQMPIRGRVSHDLSDFPVDLRIREFPC